MQLQGRTLVITEKSKVAKVFAKVVQKQEPISWIKNHYESQHYIIEAVEGHIFQLCDIADYTGEKQWSLDELPFFPENYQFRFKLKDAENARQKPAAIFERIQKDLKKCNQVIHLGDADNEGQILVDIVLFQARNQLPVYRLWSNANTEDAMLKALNEIKPNEEYMGIALEGYTRMYEDWLYGINGSRFITLKMGNGHVLGIGRVNTAITTAIYDRDMKIKNFVPEIYYQAVNKENIVLQHSSRLSEREDCIDLCNELNAQEAEVIERTTKEKEIPAKKLFNLDKIQSFMAKQYKISPDQTLRAMQKIYLDGYISYPRTDSEYLSSKEMDEIRTMIGKLREYPLILKQGKGIFNDQKVVAHSALRPVKYPLQGDYGKIERLVYQAILNRFLAVFCKEPCLVDRSVMKIRCGNEIFDMKGDIQKSLGWKKYENVPSKDTYLPNYQIGDRFRVMFQPVQKQTTPPKHYTTESLMYFLNNPFAKEEHDDTDEYENIRRGAVIGTPATRASILNNIIKYGYITNEKDVYRITSRGILLIENMKKMGIEMTKEKTVEFGVTQKRVGAGQISIIDALNHTKAEVTRMCSQKDMEIQQLESSSVGKCPVCGGIVEETSKAFCCKNRDFVISKNNKYITSRQKRVTANVVGKLLMWGQVKLKGCKKTKGEGTYDVYIAFERNPDGSIKMANDIFPVFTSHF